MSAFSSTSTRTRAIAPWRRLIRCGATPIATVSTPLTWDELAGAEPDDYTMATVPDLVQGREDPWAAMDEVAQSIAPLLEMVEADEERGLGDMPYPPNYPKMPGEPKRVQPSKKVLVNWDDEGNTRPDRALAWRTLAR